MTLGNQFDNGPTGQIELSATGVGTTIDVLDLGGASFGELRVFQGSSASFADGARLLGSVAIGGRFSLDGGSISPPPFGSGRAIEIIDGGSFTGGGIVNGTILSNFGSTIDINNGQTLRINSDQQTSTFNGQTSINGGSLVLDQGGIELVDSSASILARDATIRADFLFNGGTIGFVGGNSEVLTQNNAFFTNNGTVGVSGDADLAVRGNFINLGEVQVAAGSSVTLFDNASGDGNYTGSGDVVFLGNFQPGNSPAAVNFGGDVTLGTNSTLNIELGGLLNGSFDSLQIDGAVNVDGDLVVTAIDGFQPLPGDAFTIIDADNLLGTFDGIIDTLGLTGLAFDITYTADAAILKPLRLLNGDANFDGTVSILDFAVLRSEFGTSGRAASDFNLDGTVSILDFAVLRANFGGSLQELAAMDAWAATVPEPASLAVVSLGGLLLRRRR